MHALEQYEVGEVIQENMPTEINIIKPKLITLDEYFKISIIPKKSI